MIVFRIFFTIIILTSMVSVSLADVVDDAIAAVESGDFEKGHHLLLKEANDGDARAQDELAAYYQFYKNDYGEAFRWYKKAAEQGFADGQYNVGAAYDLGQGIEQNHYEAVKWYRLAVAQNHAWAQYNFALCYLGGDGVPINKQRAAQLMAKAANQGHVDAQNNLAALYFRGDGVEQSPEKAIAWFMVSSFNGSDVAKRNLDRLLNRYSDETVREAEQIATEILQTIGN